MLERLRRSLGLAPPRRHGTCVAAVLEISDLDRLAERADAPNFAEFLRRAGVEAALGARARGGRAQAQERGVFLAAFPAERSFSPAGSALDWVVETRRTLTRLAAMLSEDPVPPRFAAGVALGRGLYGRRADDPVVSGEPARSAEVLREAARAEHAVYVDDAIASTLPPRRIFEAVPAAPGERAFSAHRLVELPEPPSAP